MLLRTSLVFLASVWSVSCLQVTPGSECAALCLDLPDGDIDSAGASSTNSSDIVCRDSDYSSQSTGIKFKNCLTCLQESAAVSDDESDVVWFLYNIRFAVDVCLFGFPRPPDAISSPCDIDHACAPLGKALKFDGLDSETEQGFGYCEAGDGVFKDSNVEACYQCLQTSPDQNYLSNCCKQTPEPGTLLGLQGSLFSQAQINVTDPPSNVTLPEPETPSNGLNTGTIAGIAIGAALLLLGGISLFIVHRRRERKHGGRSPSSPDSQRRGGTGMIPIMGPMSGPSGSAFTAGDHKPLSIMSDYELKAQRAYTNNAEFYDDLEKQMLAQRAQTLRSHPATTTTRPAVAGTPAHAHANGNGNGSALPAHPAYIPRAMSRNDTLSSRSATPEVLRPVKYQKPDSYALQQYLQANEDAISLRSHPHQSPRLAPPRSGAASRESSNRTPSPAGSATAHLLQTQTTAARTSPLVPPPPPPPPLPPPPPTARKSKVPSLSLPSVPRIRIPKKYAPPQIQIQIQGATPIDGSSNDGDLGISKPITVPEPRFQDRSMYGGGGGGPSRADPHNPPIIEQQVVMRPWNSPEELEVRSGRSAFYG